MALRGNSARVVRGICGVLLWVLLAATPGYVYAQTLPRVKIIDKETLMPLAGVTVQGINCGFAAVSDTAGYLHLPQSPQRGRVRLSMVGYNDKEISLSDLFAAPERRLQPRARILEEVVFTRASAIRRVQELSMGVDHITAAEARRLPAMLGETDILRLLQLKPGVKNAGEGTAGYYVRGGGVDQNLILLDGAPVYNPNHLLGLFSVFNNDAVRDVTLYKGAYPAGYGGRLSSVLDIHTRSGSFDSLAVSGGIGLLSSRLTVEAPLIREKSSFSISGRRTYFDIFTRAVNRANEGRSTSDPIPDYYFSDLNLRTDWKLPNGQRLWATGYIGNDCFASLTGGYETGLRWGNRTGSLNWSGRAGNLGDLRGSLFYSGYSYVLGSHTEFDQLDLASSVRTAGFQLSGTIRQQGDFRWQGGLQGMLHWFIIGDYHSSNELAGFAAGERRRSNEFAGFVQSDWDDSGPWAVSGGLRISGFQTVEGIQVRPEPRLLIRRSLGSRSSLKWSYTRMHQYLHLASLSSSSLPVDIWHPATDQSPPQTADQWNMGWTRSLGADRFFLSVEGYYKRMAGQIEFRDGANLYGNPHIESEFVYGKGRAFGAEIYLEKKSGRTTGWIGYTLAKTDRTFEDINGGKAFRPRYDRRHDLSLVVMHRINERMTLSGTWIYGSGVYITLPAGRFIMQDHAGVRTRSLIPVYGERGNFQLPSVHRLDLSLVIKLNSKTIDHDLTFSLYNAYSRRNPYFIQFKEKNDKEGYITSIEPNLVSLFPVLPGVTYNFKF